jgi:hypothetical protein
MAALILEVRHYGGAKGTTREIVVGVFMVRRLVRLGGKKFLSVILPASPPVGASCLKYNAGTGLQTEVLGQASTKSATSPQHHLFSGSTRPGTSSSSPFLSGIKRPDLGY